MNKRPGFIVVVIVFIIAIVSFYIYLKSQQKPSINPISAVPINSALIIDIKKPQKLYSKLTKNSLFKKLCQIDAVFKLNSNLSALDSVVNGNAKLNQLFTQNPFLISFHEVGNKKFYPLCIIAAPGYFETNQIFKSIETDLKNQKYTITNERYNQAKLYKISKGNTQFFYSYHKGLLLWSSSEILLEDAIRQSESEVTLLNNADLNRLIETSGQNAEANIYIQFKNFQIWLNKLIPQEYLKSHSIKQIGNWVELDLNLKSQTLLFNGFASASTDVSSFMDLFQGQKPQHIKSLKFVPVGSEAFFWFGISNYRLYKQNLREYMRQLGQLDRLETNSKQVRLAFGNNADNELENIFKNELAQVILPDETALFYIKTHGFRDASELLNKWLKNYCKVNNKNLNDYKTNFSIDKESVFPIYKMPIDYLPTRLFGTWFNACKAKYATVFDDYIIFGDTYNAVSRTIYNNVLQKTLAYDGAYTQFSDYLSSKANFFAFISLSGNGKVLESTISNNAFKFYKKNQLLIRDFYAVAWQFSAENNLYYNNILFNHQPSNAIKAATEWETRLDTLIAFKPELVINHYTKQKEIFVQDEKNNVYLINHSGRVLWKKHIEEAIMGKVFQVDYFKNGKLQYLFNTKTKIYLLDRNGNFVKRYPIKLPAAAAVPLSVFDYDKNRNYRLFVPLVNNKIIVYNIEGKTVTGFKFKNTDNRIISQVQYIRDNNKDYILITDSERIYILDRRGNTRVKPNVRFRPSKNNTFEYQQGNSQRPGRLVRTDGNGTVYFLYFNGKVEQKLIQKCSPGHYFNTKDVTGDMVSDFVFIDGNELTVYSLSGKKVYSHKFSTNIKHNPSFYRFSSKKTYVGITEAKTRNIYLFNTQGKILKGFPLPGRTRFSIGFLEPGSGRFNLVVGGNEYYLYNYKLN